MAAAAARAGGIVLALTYLLGLAEGTLIGVVAGLSVALLARTLGWSDLWFIRTVALFVVGGAVFAGMLRWGSADLGELRGVQAVLGPTVLVGPVEAAAGAWLAGVAGVLALGIAWFPLPRSLRAFALWEVEVAPWALLLATLFWAPAAGGTSGDAGALTVARWFGVVVVICTGVTACAWLTRVVGRLGRVALIGVVVVSVAAGLALMGTAL